MAATAKQYELLFQLTARLGPNFSQSFKNASKVMNTMQTDLKSADQKLRDVSAYQKQQNAVAKSKERVNDLQAEHEKLKQEIEATGEATPELTKKMQANEKALQKAKDATANEKEKLEELSNTLKEAGINTNNLDKETKELEGSYKKLEAAQKKVQEISEKQEANKQAISQTKSQLAGTVGTAVALGTALIAGPVKSAMEFQSNMSEVAKVVSWLKDETGATTKEYTELKNEILSITTQIPMTAKEISEIMAAAGQAGVATDNKSLVEFTTAAAKMGIAFDTSADQAGTWMANWRKSFKMSQEEVVTLSDKINFLGNTSGAKAQAISSIVTKIGPLGDVAGVASGEIAALGATLVSTGVQEDVAATGIKNLMLAMVQGNSVTKSQAAVLDKLGINGKKLAERMQTDATGAIMDFLNAVKKLPEAEQAATLTKYFGKESVGAIAPLLTSMDQLEANLNRVGDASQYAGSMEAEYAAKSDTVENKVLLAKNSINALSTTIGDVFLPYLGQAADKLRVLVVRFSEFAQKNPGTVKMIATIVMGLLGLKAAGLIAKLGFLEVKGGILAVQKAFTMMKGLGIAKYIKGMTGGFGGIATKMLPFIGIIAAIGAAIYYVSTHLKEVRGFIKKTFGEEGLAVFDKLWGIITEVGTAIKTAFFSSGTGVLDTLKGVLPTIISTLQTGLLPLLPMIMDMFVQILPLIGDLVTALLPVLGQLLSAVITVLATLIAELLPVAVQLISAILPLILQIVQSVLPVFIQLVSTIVPILIQIIQAVLPVIIQLIQTMLPIVMQIINTVLPVFINLLNTLVPIFTTIIQAILPVLSALLQALIPVIQLVAEIFASVLGSALQSISVIITNVMGILQGLIDFITGVFTGNWSQAWEGVKSIFGGIFGGLGEMFKAPIKVVVSAINTVIGGLNKLKVPDWVPGLGGKGINIPLIPGFKRGTNKTPDTFMAGEEGPELITNAANRKVFTAAQTGRIFNNIAKANDLNTANGVNASLGAAGTITLKVTNSPTVVVNGSDTSGIKEQLAQYDEEFLEKLREIIKTILREQKEQEGRVAYA